VKITTIVFLVLFSLLSKAQNWQAVGSGKEFDQSIRCFYSDTATGYLYVGGDFIYLNNQQVNGVAIWNSQKWDSLGSGLAWPTYAITKFNGELFGAGAVQGGIKQWNGNQWQSLTGGDIGGNGIVLSMLVFNNELYVGGMFANAGGIPTNSLAKWNGSTWSAVNSFPNNNFGGALNRISAMAIYNNELYVGGSFADSLGTPMHIAKLSGNKWMNVANGIIGNLSEVFSFATYKNELYAAGYFKQNEGNPGNHIARWNGVTWNSVGSGVSDYVKSLYVFKDELYIAGTFESAGGIPAQYLVKWDGIKWCSLGSEFDNVVISIGSHKDSLLIGGGFQTINSDTIIGIAKWIGGNYVDTCATLVGIESKEKICSVTVSPNPFASSFTIKLHDFNSSYDVEIYDRWGRKMLEMLNNPTSQIDVNMNQLLSGIYFYRIISQNGNLIRSGKLFKIQ